MVDEKNTLQNTLYRRQLTVHVTKNTIYIPARAGGKFRRKPQRPWKPDFSSMEWIFPLCPVFISTSACFISTPNYVGVGRVRAALSGTGGLSIHLKQQTLKVPQKKRGGGGGKNGQCENCRVSKHYRTALASYSSQAAVPSLGFLRLGSSLGHPWPL